MCSQFTALKLLGSLDALDDSETSQNAALVLKSRNNWSGATLAGVPFFRGLWNCKGQNFFPIASVQSLVQHWTCSGVARTSWWHLQDRRSRLCSLPCAPRFLPFMLGWFALNAPAGLGVYWVANNVLTTARRLTTFGRSTRLHGSTVNTN